MTDYLIKVYDYDGDGNDILSFFQDEPYLCFLTSRLHDGGRGRFSFLACDPFSVFVSHGQNAFPLLKKEFSAYKNFCGDPRTPMIAGMMGYIGYNHGAYQERIKRLSRDDLKLPDCVFGFYDCIITIDHHLQKLYLSSTGLPELDKTNRRKRAMQRMDKFVRKLEEGRSRSSMACLVDAVAGYFSQDKIAYTSNFSKLQYLKAVDKALAYIAEGDIYQVNLSQRFCFALPPRLRSQNVSLFHSLIEYSPTDFAAFMNAGHFQILSSSPERFLLVKDRLIQTRPMKGTRPRGRDTAQDHLLREDILRSPKDRAELLMITDLERNDLGKVCEYGSVRVKEMRTVEQYKTVFQTTSTVEGVLRQNGDVFDALEACFPGGSITGCPKIRAMDIIEELEPQRRGVYTGSMGYISFDGNMDMNILIRTLLAVHNRMYYQVGGGIVADSTPEGEYALTNVSERNVFCPFAMSNHIPTIFLDKKWIKADRGLLERLSPGILKGKGVFETMGVYEGKLFALDSHFIRLKQGLRVLKMPLRYPIAWIYGQLIRFMEKNHLKEGVLRLTIWQEHDRTQRLSLIGRSQQRPEEAKYLKGFKAMTSSITRISSRYSHIKSIDYQLFSLAYEEAKKQGADEAILLNPRGELVEGARTNLFYIQHGILYTPAVSCGCIKGVIRQIVMDLARQHHILCRAVAAKKKDLVSSEEAFLTNSFLGVMPLTSLDGKKIGLGRMGPLTKRLREDYLACVKRFL